MCNGKVLAILFAAVFGLAQWSLAQEEATEKPFFRINKNLKRVGLAEIKNTSGNVLEIDNINSGYKLKYGDKLTMKLWGKIEAGYDLSIDKNGNIIIPSVGKANVLGLTQEEARSAVQKAVDAKYSNVEVDLSLASMPSVAVRVTGHAVRPGTYLVTPVSSIAEIVAKAGGPNKWGSLSDIRMMRDGKKIASFNTYEFLLNANQAKDLIIEDNDIVFIPEIQNLVAVRGEVKYPGIYDIGSEVLLSKLVNMAGGVIPDSNSKMKICILRINPDTKLIEDAKEMIFESSNGIESKDDIKLQNYDTVIVTYQLDYVPYPEDLFRKASISGEVKIPGEYLIGENETVSSLIKKAGGLKDTAFIPGAMFTRVSLKITQQAVASGLAETQEKGILNERSGIAQSMLPQNEKDVKDALAIKMLKISETIKNRKQEGRIALDLESVVNGKSDILLENNDSLYIPPVPDWVMVAGAVYNPNSIAFTDDKPMEYYINSVGGITKDADKDEIYVMKPNGCVESKSTGYGKTMRGDIIVVPEKI